MTPPGDSILLITLLALFLACCGYYAGRMHHRHRAEVEREEAYRDGYDMATRSVFSLAARVIGPRRSSTRGIVPSQPISPENKAPENKVPGKEAPASGAPESKAPANVAPDNVAPANVAPDNVAPVKTDDSEPTTLVPGPIGFPVPPPPPAHVVAEPAALGGVTFQPFPDPRRAGGPEPETVPHPRRAGGSPSEPVPHAGGPESEPVPHPRRAGGPGLEPVPDPAGQEKETAAESAGRHLVPDALIEGATYRLPPDRIFRAKVAGATLPDDPTTRISVPKPRES